MASAADEELIIDYEESDFDENRTNKPGKIYNNTNSRITREMSTKPANKQNKLETSDEEEPKGEAPTVKPPKRIIDIVTAKGEESGTEEEGETSGHL